MKSPGQVDPNQAQKGDERVNQNDDDVVARQCRDELAEGQIEFFSQINGPESCSPSYRREMVADCGEYKNKKAVLS